MDVSTLVAHLSLSRVAMRIRQRDFPSHKRIAFADATVCVAGVEVFRICGIALHRSLDGKEWVSFPGKPGKESGTFFADVYPVNRDVRSKVTELLFHALSEHVNSSIAS